ncbi:MAG: ABC1 kinase family protein [Cyanophyceae cyanobacterium]
MSAPLQRHLASPLARQLQIFGVAVKLLWFIWWDSVAGNSHQQRQRRARWLVKQLLKLGPTFIKIGQALSTRADLIPLEYVQELAHLQDRVPQFCEDEAISIVEAELGESIYCLFNQFERVPLACASLGQVHKAQLRSGENVVVKVQRPGLEKLFNLDFEVLHRLVRLVTRYFAWTRKYQLETVYQEFFELLYQEIDYIHEGKNADRFRENFKSDYRILIPIVYWRYSTKRVLTMEYLPGIKINDRSALEACGINPDTIIQLGICCYLKQLLEDGFFQSDPHPGNMAVSEDSRLIFYDFGTMTELKSVAKEQMIKTFFAVLRKDTDEVVNTLVYMGLIEPSADMTPVKRLVEFILEQFRERPINVTEFEHLSSEIYLMFEQQPFRLPAQMTFVIKSLTTLDGIARALDPNYNLLAASQPFVRNVIHSNRQNLVRSLAQQAKDFVKMRWRRPSPTEVLLGRLDSRIEEGLTIRLRSEGDRALRRIHLGIKSLIYALLFGLTLLSSTVLLSTAYHRWAFLVFSLSGLWFLFLLRSLIALSVQERRDRLAR